MGSGSSTQQSIVNETLNSAVTNVVTSKKDTKNIAISNTNNTKVIFGPRSETIGCGINASQSIKSKNSISAMTKYENAQDLQNALKSALDSKIDKSNETEQGAFATALNVTNTKSNIRNEVKNLVENNITSDTVSEFNNTVDNLNKGVFEFNGKIDCTKGGSIDISQQILQEQLVNLITSDLTSTIVKNDTEVVASADSSSKNKVKQQGAIDALAGLMQGPFIIIGLIIIVVAVLGIVFRKSISKIAEKKAGASFGSKIKKMISAIKKM